MYVQYSGGTLTKWSLVNEVTKDQGATSKWLMVCNHLGFECIRTRGYWTQNDENGWAT